MVDTARMDRAVVPDALMREMRSSVIFLGAILARCKEATICYPGGCGYRNDTFDLLVGVAESTGDLTARAAFLHDAEAMLLEDSAVSPLCFSGTAYLLREGLTGVSHDCFGHSYFTAVSRAETSPAA